MPPMPAFYHRPTTLEDVIDQNVNRALDLLGVELDHDLFTRWQGPPKHHAPAEADGAFAALNGTPRI
jgi:hypothetical protein